MRPMVRQAHHEVQALKSLDLVVRRPKAVSNHGPHAFLVNYLGRRHAATAALSHANRRRDKLSIAKPVARQVLSIVNE